MADEIVVASSVLDQYINQVADPVVRTALRVLSDRIIDTSTGVVYLSGTGAPTSGTSGTGVGLANVGSTYTDTSNGQIYSNTNTLASPTWTVVAPIGITSSAAELNYNDITSLGTGAASKAVILDAGEDYVWPATGILTYGVLKDPAGTTLGATAAELNYNDLTTLGTGEVSKAVVLSSTGTYVGPTVSTAKLTWSVTSTSTSGSTSVEPLVHATTMSGIGGVGGRAKFSMDTSVTLGAWSNALKALVTYGATGKTTGLGSAFVAEMTLSAGTVDGTYAPVEIELNMGTAGVCGTATSLIYASVNDAAATTFDTAGYLLNLAGVTAGTSTMFMNVGTTTALVDFVKGLRIKVAGTDYVIPLITAAEFAS